MADLIPKIGILQDAFAKIGSHDIKLPQIVVIGSQSSGKSSVIEGIVKKDFLPRGKDMVTRCPIMIQLIRTDNYLPNSDYATFDHIPNKKFTDFKEVQKEIETKTASLIGKNEISKTPINLKIYSDKVVNLSLIDLPGIIKNKADSQPEGIEDKIRELNMQYIKNDKSIIVVVTPANDHIMNSEGLSFAREVDDKLDRTLCVLTKLDLMDLGTNATDYLNGKLIKIKRGIVGVVNRSQEDIIKNVSVEECLKKEKKFFEDNYPLHAKKQGIEYLGTTLSELLISHIHGDLPALRKRIAEKKVECEKVNEPSK